MRRVKRQTRVVRIEPILVAHNLLEAIVEDSLEATWTRICLQKQNTEINAGWSLIAPQSALQV